MERFLVGSDILAGDINIGVAPGRFDTKQLILSAIAVLYAESLDKFVKFVRTVDMTVLSKCSMFINDDFTSLFPVIPSYYDIEKTWDNNCERILRKYNVIDKESVEIVSKSVKEKICNLEAMDCMMELYTPDNSYYHDSFSDALKITLRLIEKAIVDSANDKIFSLSLIQAVENATSNYIISQMYVPGWRRLIFNMESATNVEYAIFADNGGTYFIEALNKDLILKKYVKGLKGLTYSGRFFLRVNDLQRAKEIIQVLPSSKIESTEKKA